jgi:hypothetical protein
MELPCVNHPRQRTRMVTWQLSTPALQRSNASPHQKSRISPIERNALFRRPKALTLTAWRQFLRPARAPLRLQHSSRIRARLAKNDNKVTIARHRWTTFTSVALSTLQPEHSSTWPVFNSMHFLCFCSKKSLLRCPGSLTKRKHTRFQPSGGLRCTDSCAMQSRRCLLSP